MLQSEGKWIPEPTEIFVLGSTIMKEIRMEPSNKDHEAQEYYDRGNTITSQARKSLAWECEVFPKVRSQVQSLAVTTVANDRDLCPDLTVIVQDSY